MTRFLYCPECRTKLELIQKEDGRTVPACPRGHYVHYNNPNPCTGTLLEKAGTFLALKRAHDPHKGTWELPGGYIEVDETAEQALIREIKEETGLEIEIVSYIGSFVSTYGSPDMHTLGMHYHSRVTGGKWRLGSESQDAEWFRLEDFPPIKLDDNRAALEVFKAARL